MVTPATLAFLKELRDFLAREMASVETDLERVSTLISEAAVELGRSFRDLEGHTKSQREQLTQLLVAMNQDGAPDSHPAVQGVIVEASEAIKGLTAILAEVGRDSQRDLSNAEAIANQMKTTLNVLAGIGAMARQSRMLSINASIEARRVGEGGRGFEVVAREVRGLAHYSKQLADDIGAQIEKTQQILTLVQSGLTNTSERVTGSERVQRDALRSLEEMAMVRARVAAGLADLETLNQGVVKAVGDAVRCLQFGDIVGQLVASLRERLARLVEAVKAIDRLTAAGDGQSSTLGLEELRAVLTRPAHMPVSASDMGRGDIELF